MPKTRVRKKEVLPQRGKRPASPDDVFRLLSKQQGTLVWKQRYAPVDELVITILSQHTSDLNAERAYTSLQKVFPTWHAVADAPIPAIEKAIRTAGLSNQKAPRIKKTLRTVQERRGVLNLEFLKDLPLAEAKAWLQSIKGVGPKTAAVVLCFALGMPAMAVDTHVYRVSRRLGLVSLKASVDQAHDILENMTPPERVYPFHVYLIMHGRQVCKALRPLCESCILNAICPSSLVSPSRTKAPPLKLDGKRRTAHGAALSD